MHNIRLLKEYFFRIIAISCLLLLLLGLVLIFGSLLIKSLPNIIRAELQISHIDHQKSPMEILDRNLAELNLVQYKNILFSRSMLYDITNATNNNIWVPIKFSAVKEKINEDLWNDLVQRGEIRTRFNIPFLTSADSAYSEAAGIGASLKGLMFLLIVALSIGIPIATLSAIYFEIFVPRNFITKACELLIFNLSSVPSIIFGILGFVVFSYFDIPRSSSLMGGLTLAIMMMPIIHIATREAIRRVPRNILEAAISLGIPRIQILWDYILPLALFDITKSILLALSRIIGETAPLIIVGMVAFIADFPLDVSSPSATISTIIYLWSENPDPDFMSKTASGTICLLLIVIVINLAAELINRKRLE
jgi:phosphate transport system permease protein